jgi:MFS family permease
VVFGLYGGVLADRFDRRRLMVWCEAALGGCAALLMLNALAPKPSVWPLFVVAALMMATAALRRPSLEASVPRVVPQDQLTAASALMAGAADMISGIFRGTLWNQTMPDALRGGLAGIELLSYSLGPSAGQICAGAVAGVTSARFSLTSGGLLCTGAVGLVCLALPGFTRYRAQVSAPADGQE